MNIFATARFLLHLAVSALVTAILVTLLVAPDILPANTIWFVLALSVFGALSLFVLAILMPKDTAIANDELALSSERASLVFGYWITLFVFLVFLGLSLTGHMDARTAFYFLGFPLGVVPSLYMVFAFLQGRAG